MEKMPPSVNKAIKRKVIEQWISGCPRDNIALDNNIGADTVSSIISNYKLDLNIWNLTTLENWL
jgi:hypothetical protein